MEEELNKKIILKYMNSNYPRNFLLQSYIYNEKKREIKLLNRKIKNLKSFGSKKIKEKGNCKKLYKKQIRKI